MPDDETARSLARAAIQQGKVPATAQTRTWGGPGVGRRRATSCRMAAHPRLLFPDRGMWFVGEAAFRQRRA